jgi:isopentenyl-diphosphate delta-isomerase
MEQVILVDEKGNYKGLEEKIEAHRLGLLHKAFSIIIVNDKREMLLQKRGTSKYHFGGLWSNACCSHHHPQETTEQSLKRKLKQELGIETQLEYLFTFIYKVKDTASNLFEHEYDEVYIGKYNGEIPFNKEEMDEVRWVSMEALRNEIELQPEKFSYWFKEIMKEFTNMIEATSYFKN